MLLEIKDFMAQNRGRRVVGTVAYQEEEEDKEEKEERGKKFKWVSLFTFLDVYTKWVTKQNDLFCAAIDLFISGNIYKQKQL